MNASFTDQSAPVAEPSVFQYEKETLTENLKYDSNKTKNSLFVIGTILFLGDLVGLSMANALNASTFIYILIVPAIYFGLGFFARVKPMPGITIAAILFVLIIALSIYAYGARSIISGLIVKAILIYFFIKGFSHAKEAEQAKKNLAAFN